MTELIINQLSFSSNKQTILNFLKSKDNICREASAFSLNSIKNTPESLTLPLNLTDLTLSKMNIDLPELDEKTEQTVLSEKIFEHPKKRSESEIRLKIEEIGKYLSDSPDAFEHNFNQTTYRQAVANYDQLGYFTQFDWCIHHWGTAADVSATTQSTFQTDSPYIEFETAWTPPLAALQLLANTFPSVKFRYQYRFKSSDEWFKKQFFPFPPFGY